MCTYVRICQITISIHFFALGKKYCYGSTQGEYCDCDYCKCKHGYGSTGKGHCHWLQKKITDFFEMFGDTYYLPTYVL